MDVNVADTPDESDDERREREAAEARAFDDAFYRIFQTALRKPAPPVVDENGQLLLDLGFPPEPTNHDHDLNFDDL